MIFGLILSVGEYYPLWPDHSSRALTRIVGIELITQVSHQSMAKTKQPRRLRYRSQLTCALLIKPVKLRLHDQIILYFPVETCRALKIVLQTFLSIFLPDFN